MFEKRNVKQDLTALLLLALVVFLAASLFSYHRSDPSLGNSSGALVYPGEGRTQNICGPAGAWAADLLLRLMGIGAYYLVISLAIFDIFLLLRRTIDQRVVRGVGWAASLLGFTAIATMFIGDLFPSFWDGPEVGAGGVLGAVGSSLLLMHFALAGAYILAISIGVAGLVMCTDYVIFRAGLTCLSGSMRLCTSVLNMLRPGAERTEEQPSEKEDQEVSIRILGRNANRSSDEAEEDEYEEDEYEEDEYEEEYEEDEEEAPPVQIRKGKRGDRRRLGSTLKIKKPAKPNERQAMIESLEAASQENSLEHYQLPDINLLLPGEELQYASQEKEVRRKAKILEKTFADFGFNVRVVEIETGPVIAQYEVELEAGLRLSKITGLADDLAIALRVPSVRIVAPIPGKNTVGIEVPNTQRGIVRLREVMEEDSSNWRKMKIPIFLGKDVSGRASTVDLTTLPHLLIAGRTGTGKSVCLNSIITSMVITRRPDKVKTLMIDPKMVELSPYKKLPHLMHPVVTDMKKAEAILAWAVDKMEERYSFLARAGVRHVSGYNQLGEEELLNRIQPETDEERNTIPRHLPYVVIIADEMADLMITSAKEVEGHIIRLAQKSRAVGIHLVLATQKPTVDVITGLIKSNLPARISFQVASRTDSRVVLDEMGADKLLGNGDMLFLSPGTSTLLRGQGTFMSDDEITNVVDSVATNSPQFVHELVQLKPAGETDASTSDIKNRDELYESAIDVVIREERGSVSLLQRTLGIGYGRAARLIDFMAEDGIVGPYNGSQAREVLIDAAGWAEMNSEQPSATTEGTGPNRIRLAATTEEEVEYAEYATDEVEESPTDGASDEWEADADDVEYEEDALADGEEEEYEEEEYEEDALADGEEEEYEEEEYEEDELADGEEEEYEEEYEEEDAYEEETV